MKRMLKKLYYKNALSRFLFEAEGDEAEGEEAEGEEEVTDEESDEPEDEDEDEDESPEPEDLPNTIDADIEAVLIDFETEARKIVNDEVTESKRPRTLLESEELDLDHFAGEVARLVKNYDNLLDMEKMLVDKAEEFLTQRYSAEEGERLVDKLETQHDISITSVDASEEGSTLDTPLAVGAGSGGE